MISNNINRVVSLHVLVFLVMLSGCASVQKDRSYVDEIDKDWKYAKEIDSEAAYDQFIA